jgi:hypothetical protein
MFYVSYKELKVPPAYQIIMLVLLFEYDVNLN